MLGSWSGGNLTELYLSCYLIDHGGVCVVNAVRSRRLIGMEDGLVDVGWRCNVDGICFGLVELACCHS